MRDTSKNAGAYYMRSVRCLAFFAVMAISAGLSAHLTSYAQTRTNSTGTGGINQIRGRIFLPNGKASETPISVELQSTSYGTLNVQTDLSGSFSFGGLNPGTYTVVVNAGESFEIAREYITIDPEVQTSTFRVTPSPKTFTVPIYLQAKRGEIQKTGVINAKWAGVPRSVIERYERGLELAKENKAIEAATEFQKAIDMYPSFSPAHTALGKTLLMTGKLNEATRSFRAALRYDPLDFDAHLDLGIALLNLKQYNDAEPELVTAAYLNRSAVTPHYYLGIVFVMKNDLDIARKAFETAKELKGGKSLPSLHKYLGRIYMAKNMNKEAIEEFETYIKLVPKAQDVEIIRKDISNLKNLQN